MFEAMSGIFCFVTITVSFAYGTRVAWVCGQKCQFKEKPETRKKLVLESLPTAVVIYFFGFVIVFSLVLDGFLTVSVFSLVSAIVLANLVLSMAMPELKRRPEQDRTLS